MRSAAIRDQSPHLTVRDECRDSESSVGADGLELSAGLLPLTPGQHEHGTNERYIERKEDADSGLGGARKVVHGRCPLGGANLQQMFRV
jgi:hypothetical protein